jgi:ATP-dependent Clp protease ATP-binding subunit ClpB
MVDEPAEEDAISILRGLKERYETHHKINKTDAAIVSAVQLSNRYITDRFLPDKAIDLIDEAAARLRLEMNSMPEELDEVERRIRQLEIEREAMKREKDEGQSKSAQRRTGQHGRKAPGDQSPVGSRKRSRPRRIQKAKEELEQLKQEGQPGRKRRRLQQSCRGPLRKNSRGAAAPGRPKQAAAGDAGRR